MDPVARHVERAYHLAEVGRGSDALAEARAARSAASEDPRALGCHVVVARAFAGPGEQDEATASLLAAEPENPMALQQRALHLEVLAREFPDGWDGDDGHGNRIVADERDASLAEAEELADRAVGLDPDDAEGLKTQAVVRIAREDHGGAEESLRRLLEISPEDAHAHALWSELHRVRALNPFHLWALRLSGWAIFTLTLSLLAALPLWVIGRILAWPHEREAAKAARRAVELDPEDPDHLMMYAQAQARRMQPETAADLLSASAAADTAGAQARGISEELRSLWTERAFFLMFGALVATIWAHWFLPGVMKVAWGVTAGAAVWLIVWHCFRLQRMADDLTPKPARKELDAGGIPFLNSLGYLFLAFVLAFGEEPSIPIFRWFVLVQLPPLVFGIILLLWRWVAALAGGYAHPESRLAQWRRQRS